MIFLYQIFIRLFSFSIRVYALFSKKAKLFVSGRTRVFETIANSQHRTSNLPFVWFHCSSLGEFEQARPLIETFKVQSSKFKVIITFFSPSGYEVRKNFEGADLVCYLPTDTPANAKKFIDVVKPVQAFFVKYDFWYNYLNELSLRKIPAYLVSANFRQEQFRGLYGSYLRKVLPFFTRIFVQNDASAKLLQEQNIMNITVSGDLRYDRVAQTVSTPKKISLVEAFKGDTKLIIGGSTWPAEERLLKEVQSSGFKALDSKAQPGSYKIIIAPHEISENHVDSIIHLFSHTGILRYSQISKEPVSSALDRLKSANVLVVDTIGLLSSLYQYADIALIGGGFGSGIHNILEAVAFGVPVIFGPNHHKFPEAAEIIQQGGGFCINNKEELEKVIQLLSDEMVLKMASMTCKNFVQVRKGATDIVIKMVSLSGLP